jgi:dTDP-L-rhamnose 4-epimerase
MDKQVLITGGAGFIGSHLADHLLSNGYQVKVLDNLTDQVHGPGAVWPDYLSKNVQFIKGEISDPETVQHALEGVETVFHFAASVGVGQSMYKISKYTEINNLGTAVLLENMIGKDIRRLVVASSMSVYGEGLYKASDGTLYGNTGRSIEQLKRCEWEPTDCNGQPLEALPTPESKQPSLESIYALSKFGQERMSLMIGRAYSIPTVALRFFNVYGTRQSLSNPYTGVLAIFASRYLNGNCPIIFEDGLQKRDFVAVADVCNACRLALEIPAAAGQVFNIGSGVAFTIKEIAQKMGKVLGREHLDPIISGKYRFGDIRHCFADISLAQKVLGYEPNVNLERGLLDFAQWLQGQLACDQIDLAHAELIERGLTV